MIFLFDDALQLSELHDLTTYTTSAMLKDVYDGRATALAEDACIE